MRQTRSPIALCVYLRRAPAEHPSQIARSEGSGVGNVSVRRISGKIQPRSARAAIGLDGGVLDDATGTKIQRAKGKGMALDAKLQQSMQRGFGADFSGVRIHHDSDSDHLNQKIQAKAFTTGSDIFFRQGEYLPHAPAGQKLLAHELTHVLQQGAAVSRMPAMNGDRGEGLIQRHASWEHKMLGDIDPATLEIIAAGRDVADEEVKRGDKKLATRQSAKTIRDDNGKTIDIETVLHTIDQEIRRLQYFKSSPPTGSVADATAALEKLDSDDRKDQIAQSLGNEAKEQKAQEIDDAKWGVRLVSLTLKDGKSFLVTYGEMNTLADFYGSAKEIALTPADNFRSIVGGVREESIRKFMRLRNELTVSGPKQYKPDAAEHDIKGAIGNKGTLRGAGAGKAVLNRDQYGELKLMGEMGNEARAKIDGKDETSYTAGLGRNACHFAPHSWHAWAAAHKKAVALAAESWKKKTQSLKWAEQISAIKDAPSTEGDEAQLVHNRTNLDRVEKLSADKLNAALIENGFGDHFLQDSYAAGHLINKTLIMQWFAKWLDTKGSKRMYTSDKDWRKVQQIAYGQADVAGGGLADPSTIATMESNDPQSIENLSGDWTDRFAALGLKIPGVLRDASTDQFNLFTWWQGQAMNGKHLKSDYKDLAKDGPIKAKNALQTALVKLIDDGVVFYKHYSTADRAKGAEAIGFENWLVAKDLELKKEYIPQKSNEEAFNSAVTSAKEGDSGAYEKMAKAVTYDDYHKFLNHGYLQLSSNVLHDYFCLNGLDVATDENETPYRIYGDNAMLGNESSRMVKYSAETAHRSRDSIYELAETGATVKTTAAIAARFPTWVRPVGAKKNLSLADWHGDGGSLHTFCVDTIFPDVTAFFSKSTAVASDTLADKISKDDTEAVHSGEAF